jgi:hypothetical protein
MKKILSAIVGIAAVFIFAGKAAAGSETVFNTLYGLNAGPNTGLYSGSTFFGSSAGYYNTTGGANNFMGSNAGYANTIGSFNSFIGNEAGKENSSGNNNSFVGYKAGFYNTTGSNNTLVGYQTGQSSSANPLTGTNNTFMGYMTGFVNSTGSNNTFIGLQAGYSNTQGSGNSIFGNYAGYNNITGNNNVFLGYGAGASETGSDRLYIDNCHLKDGSGDCTFPLIYGEFDNRFVKIDGTIQTTHGIKFSDGSIQTTAPAGVATSLLTTWGSSTGSQGNNSIFIGTSAGTSNTSGSSDNFIGYKAGYSNTSGTWNVFLGDSAGYSNNKGGWNTFLGAEAGYTNTTGSHNTFVGTGAGTMNSTGNYNVFLGYSAGGSETGSNKLYIDNCNTGGNCSSPLIYGEFDNRIVRIDGTVTVAQLVSASDERYKKNIHPLEQSLDKLTQLSGVSYEWKTDEFAGKGFREGRQIGLIAQDVEKVIPELVQTDANGYKAVAYDKLVPVLIEAVKEQQKEITKQREEAKNKDIRIDKLEKALEAMDRRLASLQEARIVALK